jgi:hypothetical protein
MLKIRQRILLLLITVIGFFPGFYRAQAQAQVQEQDQKYIRGKIIDSNTSEPLPFATVMLRNNLLGIHSNADGDFIIRRDASFLTDSVIFTCIGYERYAISYQRLQTDRINLIKITPKTYELKAVQIIAFKNYEKARRIVTKAIRNIRWNYPHDKFSYVGYYRDYQKKDKQYFNLNEAIIQADDGGFRTKSLQNMYRLLDFRINPDFPRIDVSPYYELFSRPYFELTNKFIEGATLPDQGGNELFILMTHDAIRNYNAGSFSFVNTFDRDFLVNHIFTGMSKVYNDNIVLYKISFEAKKWLTGDSLTVYGDIFIGPEDYSIHKLDYHGDYIRKGNEREKMFNIKTEYGYENGPGSKMHLRYISFDNTFNVIDTTDQEYFMITRSYFLSETVSVDFALRSDLFIEFNHKINKSDACDTSCYRLYLEGRRARIRNVDVGDTKVKLTLEPVTGKNERDSGLSDFRVLVLNIRDVNGRVVNERRYIQYHQFRELFVQEYNSPDQRSDSCYLINKPLIRNCISGIPEGSKYWMNTPVNQ